MLKLADQPHQSKQELEPREALPVRMLALVETTSFDSALYVMGVKAAAFPSGSTTRDYETGNERAATRYRTEGTGLGSAYYDYDSSGAGGSGSTSMGGTVTTATEEIGDLANVLPRRDT